MKDNEGMTTSYSDKCFILSELWLSYRDEEEFSDFVEYNDLGLPLAYAIANELVHSTTNAELLVSETFDLLLGALGVEDTGFDTLEQLLEAS